ncbi:MAG: Eco57I restriction-modification methylase domain-containing protein [Ignavibacteriales bacterium]|nr:Eco57I restriction-modification methylase domain-containing protein [Ignavibacteriales bacterium]
MKEAVEIAKLRLFLKLVATVDADHRKPNLGLEPLPDIDFNIRAGNTLVGIAAEKELDNAFEGHLDLDGDLGKIKEKCDVVARAFQRYKEIQLADGDNFKDFKKVKEEINNLLSSLKDELDHLIAKTQYGIDLTDKNQYHDWQITHQPFHWFAEFYEIINDRDGFDVVIGNPPYVNFKKIDYSIISSCYKSFDCKDLFALTIERSQNIITEKGRSGFIIPLSGLSTETMKSLKNLIFSLNSNSWNSYYSASDQPASLFTCVRHRLLITLNEYSKLALIKRRYSTNFIKWFSNEREQLFSKFLKYAELSDDIPANSKLSNGIEKSILSKLNTNKTLNNYIVQTGSIVYYHNAPVHWGKVVDFIPYFSVGDNVQQSSHLKELYFDSKENSEVVICLLNSSLFYWFNWQYSNCRDLSQKDIFRMPLSMCKVSVLIKKKLCSLKTELMKDLKENSKIYQRYSGGILTEFDSFYPAFSKPIIDKIDTLLAEHYGFTEEELDFIINYDIKYRMGKELEED